WSRQSTTSPVVICREILRLCRRSASPLVVLVRGVSGSSPKRKDDDMYYLALLTGDEGEAVAQPGTAEFDAEVEQYAAFDARVAAVIAGGAALYPSADAVTIRQGGTDTLITDGPFAEHAEVVGGFYVFDVPDLDAATDLVRQLPALATGSV